MTPVLLWRKSINVYLEAGIGGVRSFCTTTHEKDKQNLFGNVPAGLGLELVLTPHLLHLIFVLNQG